MHSNGLQVNRESAQLQVDQAEAATKSAMGRPSGSSGSFWQFLAVSDILCTEKLHRTMVLQSISKDTNVSDL